MRFTEADAQGCMAPEEQNHDETCNRRHATSAAWRIGRGLRANVVLLGLFGLAACGQDFSPQPPSGEPMTVSDISTHSLHDFAPADAPYQRIADWVAANRTGWSQYLGSPPSAGTMISYGNVSLQFVDHQVLARAPGGIYEKATSVNVEVLLR